MRHNIKKILKEFQNNNNLSSYINFSMCIRDKKLPVHIIRNWFNKLVEKEDYEKNDKYLLIRHLKTVSNGTLSPIN